MDNKQRKTSMSVMEMGASLGLRKTDSYWLVNKGYFKTIQAAGVTRVMIDSFEDWYAHQFTYRKIDGEEPGQALREEYLTSKDIAQFLGISMRSVEGILSRNTFETADIYGKRCIVRASFDKWYASQFSYVGVEDMERRAEINASLSMPEIARLLNVPRKTVYDLVNKHCFEVVMNGKQKRIPKESFEKWYAGQDQYKKSAAREETAE